MTNKTDSKSRVSFTMDPKIYNELTLLAQRVGFENLEALLKNYLREVLISARTEVATAQLRDTIIRGSSDLDNLKPKDKS